MAMINRGIGAAMGAALLFGVSTPLAKLLVGRLPALLLSGSMYLGSGIGLACVLVIRAAVSTRTGPAWPRGAAVGWLLGAIVIGGIIAPYLLMLGLQVADAASAALILNFEGVFTAVLAWFVFKEHFDRRIAVGMVLIVAGGAVLALGPSLRVAGLAGAGPILGACLGWAIDNNLTRKVSLHDAMFIACAKGLVAGSTSVALALAGNAQLSVMSAMPMAAMLQAALLGFVTYGLSLSLFVFALRTLGAARTGAYFSLAPFIGAALAVALGAPLSAALLAAGVLMGAGVWLHLTEHHEHRHRHWRMSHDHPHTHDAHHRHEHGFDWDGREPHSHEHVHQPLEHAHAHYPDVHHRHEH
jgi:drug/metabolite transporter (DMT)-like permease